MRFFLLLGVLLMSACADARVNVDGDEILVLIQRQTSESLEISTTPRWSWITPLRAAEASETAALRYASDWCPSAVMTDKVLAQSWMWSFRFSCPARAAAATPEG